MSRLMKTLSRHFIRDRANGFSPFHLLPTFSGRHYVSEAEASESEEDSYSPQETTTPEVRWHRLPPVPPPKPHFPGQEPHLYTASKWVARCCPELPHSLIQKIFRKRTVRMEVKDASTTDALPKLCRASTGTFVNEGAVLCLPASLVMDRLKPNNPPKTKKSIKASEDEQAWLRSLVIHKDEDLLVINKPPGLSVQGGTNVDKSLDSMMAAALSYEYEEGPRLVHRLDKDVSGAMVLGRTLESTVRLQEIMTNRSSSPSDAACKRGMEKRYVALIIGVPPKSKGFITNRLVKVVVDNGKSERIMVADENTKNIAMEAITQYKVLRPSVLGCTWVELRPITGRKHQLRVHCAQGLDMPIVGDEKYGWRAHRHWQLSRDLGRLERFKLKKKMQGSILVDHPKLHLHSQKLFIPSLFVKEGEKMQTMELIAPLPEHMAASWKLCPPERPPTLKDTLKLRPSSAGIAAAAAAAAAEAKKKKKKEEEEGEER